MAGKKKKNYSQSQQGNKQINKKIKKDSLKKWRPSSKKKHSRTTHIGRVIRNDTK
jgi:hypothetical protein